MNGLISALSDERPWQAYGIAHQTVLVVTGVLAAALVVWGRITRHTTAANLLARRFALVALAIEVAVHVNQGLPTRWDANVSYPFELCDLAGMAAVFALWTGRPWAAALVYYWGLTLTMQGLMTPDLSFDFPNLQFIQFFVHHSLIVVAAAFLTWGQGFRPSWRGWATAALATIAWGAAMLAFNGWMGTNYLYVCRKPPNASLFDLFGPWPVYLLVSAAVACAVWALITLPWHWVERPPTTSHRLAPPHLPDYADLRGSKPRRRTRKRQIG